MRTLITGGHGFVGRHLAHHLISCGDDVALTYLPGDPGSGNAVEIPPAAQSMALDVTKKEMVVELISLLKPDVIYHLAGITFVPQAEKEPALAFSINYQGTVNVLEAIARHSKSSRMLCVGSSEIYGSPRPGGLPLTELSEMRPATNYGLSKAAADLAAFKAWYKDSVHTVRVRPFPHIGPGQSESFAVAGFAKQVAMVKLGKCEPVIKVGNLEAKREYCDVSDIARGYREALLNGKPGEAYNLCSGQSLAMSDWLNMLISLAKVEVEIQQDPAKVRKVDIVDNYGSYAKASRDFGWKPRIETEAMLASLLAYWLEVLKSEPAK